MGCSGDYNFSITLNLNTMTQLPNLASSFSRMKIQDMLAGCKGGGIFGDVIREGALTERDATISMCRDQIKDSRSLMVSIIGEQCVLLIEQL
jgi:hypothetical protein